MPTAVRAASVLRAYCGNNLMNMILSKLYASQRDKFKGSGTSSGLRYTFDVTEVPVFKLLDSNPDNFEILLKKVVITVSDDTINFNNTLQMKATGSLYMKNSTLTISDLKVTTSSTNMTDKIIIGIINTQVIPKISNALAHFDIPQLRKAFSYVPSSNWHSNKVSNGVLEVVADITGKSDISSADVPDNLSALNSGTDTNALMIGMVSEDAVNLLIKALNLSLSEKFSESERTGKKGEGIYGAAIKGTIKATTPVLNINNGNGKVSTTVSFSGLEGGLDINAVKQKWKWFSLGSPKVDVAFTHKLSASGNTGIITLIGVDSIKVSLNWNMFEKVENEAESLLNNILRDKLSSMVKGKKFEIFELPSVIPGTSINANLSFDSDGLEFYKSSVQAKIRIKT